VLSINQIELFLNSFRSDWARDVAVLILNTGLRQNDALGLKKFNVDLESGVIRLLQGKTGRRVEIPLNDVVESLIRARWHNGSDLVFPSPKTGRRGTSIKKALEGASKRAGIDKLVTRVLRRTFGTILNEMNYSSQVIAKLLGHGDLRSVHRYERGTRILRDAVEALPNTNPAKILPITCQKAG
jgi:integrase